MEPVFDYQDCFHYLVAESIGTEELEKAAREGRKLRIKLGIDPTSPDIHIGRAIVVWRMRAFQEMGHEIHLIVGDFTGQIGDTSDKESERPMLSPDEVAKNLERYEEQLWMILNPDKKEQVIFHRNSEWLAPLTLAKIGQLADAFSVNTFIKRELIARRLDMGSRVSLREMLYPVLQGYDSVMIKADIELGGTDQRFNLLAGRTLQEQAQMTPQGIIMNPLLAGLDGNKMSSSQGNVISLLDTPQDKFGKLMRIHDDLMTEYLAVYPRSLQPFSSEELAERLEQGENPRDLKLTMAHRLVALYHDEEAADREKEQFISQFSEDQIPEEMTEISRADLQEAGSNIITVLVQTELAPSNSEARRLIEQRGVRINGEVIEDSNTSLPEGEVVVQVGKRRFVRIRPS